MHTLYMIKFSGSMIETTSIITSTTTIIVIAVAAAAAAQEEVVVVVVEVGVGVGGGGRGGGQNGSLDHFFCNFCVDNVEAFHNFQLNILMQGVYKIKKKRGGEIDVQTPILCTKA